MDNCTEYTIWLDGYLCQIIGRDSAVTISVHHVEDLTKVAAACLGSKGTVPVVSSLR